MKPLLVFAVCLWSMLLFSQAKSKIQSPEELLLITTKGNLVSFKPETPLIPIAGAPKPSYSIYGIRRWSLQQKEPKHTYKKKGTYTSRLTVTNNYDNGKPPATRPKSRCK
jgi:hypothetical protein